VAPFLDELREVLVLNCEYEIVVVDDGSYDGTFERLRTIANSLSILKVIRFSRNFGQTAALVAGIRASRGDIIVTIDGDLENDPRDIPRMLHMLNRGYDVVSGWRKGRWQGKFLTRRLPSLVANIIIARISGVPLHDYGCTLKMYRRQVIEDVMLYGEMHRFIPIYVKSNGASIAEFEVRHRTRIHGYSKYGIGRTFRVFLDLLFAVYATRYMNKPIHFFGGVGILVFVLGFFTGITALVLKVMGLRSFVETPLPVVASLFIVVGVQLVVMGILAEVTMRIYYGSQKITPYKIRETLNLPIS
jgi:glycosyltransferase involved in cell wall biosynthesis